MTFASQHLERPRRKYILAVDNHGENNRTEIDGSVGISHKIDENSLELSRRQWLKWFCEAGGLT